MHICTKGHLQSVTRTGAMAFCAGYAWTLCYCEGCGHHLVSQTSFNFILWLRTPGMLSSACLNTHVEAAQGGSHALSCLEPRFLCIPTASQCLCRADLLQVLSPAPCWWPACALQG